MRFNPGWPMQRSTFGNGFPHFRNGAPTTQAERDFVGALSLFRAIAKFDLGTPTPQRVTRAIRELRAGESIRIRATGKIR